MFNRNKIKIKYTLDYADAVRIRNILANFKCTELDLICPICPKHDSCKCFLVFYKVLDKAIYECKKGKHNGKV